MRSILLITILVLSSLNTAFAQNDNFEIALSKLLQDFSEREDIVMLIDPRVKSNVRVFGKSAEKLDFSELHTILNLHGFAIAKVDDMYIVSTKISLKHQSLVVADGDSYDQYSSSESILTVIDIKHVPAAKMVPILRPLVPQDGYMSAYIPSNKLLVYTNKHNTEELLKVIKRLDVKTDFAFQSKQTAAEN